jgi:hypothetical protein
VKSDKSALAVTPWIFPRSKAKGESASASCFFHDKKSGNYRIKNLVETLACVFRQESQHKISILLQQGVLPSIPSIRIHITEMLRPIQLNDHAGFLA